MFKVFGFSVEPKKSNLRHGGTGVFLVQGKAPAGSVVALYPGKCSVKICLHLEN